VAALGDSFTDAMTLDEAAGWPRVLEGLSGLAVQNYGTAGFGPQQELRVLTDYALVHHPRVVVLAYFAGNDLFDAEAFDEYDRSNGAVRRADPGWPIKDVVSRADTSFVVSAFHAARRWAAGWDRVEATTTAPVAAPPAGSASAPPFDRGMFTVPVNGQRLRFAFMPPYLNTLRWSERELSARKGWALTTSAIAAMRDAARAGGAELIVMFVPFKSQVYLPAVQASMPRDAIADALRYYLPESAVDVDVMMRNRLAQNAMMRRFCREEGIRFLDTTEALAAEFRRGANVYFPDESHLNEAGQGVVAQSLLDLLGGRLP
jgi:lysophospholipase L1-like esterase